MAVGRASPVPGESTFDAMPLAVIAASAGAAATSGGAGIPAGATGAAVAPAKPLVAATSSGDGEQAERLTPTASTTTIEQRRFMCAILSREVDNECS